MNYRITKVDNKAHTATIMRDDGKEVDFTVPKGDRYPTSKKNAYIVGKINMHKNLDIVPLSFKSLAKKLSDGKPHLLTGIAIIQTIAIIVLLLRH